MGLLESRNVYKPFEYPWAYDFYKKQSKAHWMPEESPLDSDIQDYRNKLPQDQQDLLTQIFRFFTQADVDVAGGYCDHYIPMFKPPEIRMMLTTFAGMEAVHIDAYSQLIDTLGFPETEYSMFMEYESMVNKHEYLSSFGTDTLQELATTMAVFSALTEGVQLFSSFAILMNFPRNNLMKAMGQVITWSIRDETLHVQGMTQLFRQLIEENPRMWNDELKFNIYSAAERVLDLEYHFIDTVFDNVTLPDLTPEEVKGHIRNIADRRLLNLGLKPIFKQKDSPIAHWLDPLLIGVEHTNFFENRATEYTKSGTTGNWQDVFR